MNNHIRYSRLRPPPETPKDEICKCGGNKPIKLMCALSYNPLHCIDCNLEVLPESLSLSDKLIELIASWRNLYDAIDRLWLDSGGYEAWAGSQLIDIGSPVNKLGMAVRKDLDVVCRCYYWYFQDQSKEGFESITKCPSCKNPFSVYGSGIFPQHVCEQCSIITVGE
jgi:predicted  nucleic acid-binding Zn ribbon protein